MQNFDETARPKDRYVTEPPRHRERRPAASLRILSAGSVGHAAGSGTSTRTLHRRNAPGLPCERTVHAAQTAADGANCTRNVRTEPCYSEPVGNSICGERRIGRLYNTRDIECAVAQTGLAHRRDSSSDSLTAQHAEQRVRTRHQRGRERHWSCAQRSSCTYAEWL